MSPEYQAIFDAAVAADDAWQAELVRVYGKAAGDMRYGLAGKATPRLRELFNAKRAADDELLEASHRRLQSA